MHRRNCLKAVGTGTAMSLVSVTAGCADAVLENGSDEGAGDESFVDDNADEEQRTDDSEESDMTVDESSSDNESNDDETGNNDTDEENRDDSQAVEFVSLSTNSPVEAGNVLEVVVELQNRSQSRIKGDVTLIVGDDPTAVANQNVTIEPDEIVETILEFETVAVEHDQEFPIRVVTNDSEAESTVEVIGTKSDDDGTDSDDELDIEWISCTRVEVTGTFEDDDVVFASTGFYDCADSDCTEGLFGNTIIEDGVRFGDHVEAPFSGTVRFEIGEERAIDERSDEIAVTIPDYGELGTVISGITTDPDDYMVAGITHSNPDAQTCLEDIDPQENE